jgi:hypothetical protein
MSDEAPVRKVMKSMLIGEAVQHVIDLSLKITIERLIQNKPVNYRAVATKEDGTEQSADGQTPFEAIRNMAQKFGYHF